jgi:DNA-binding GntR family transcriptional regulator
MELPLDNGTLAAEAYSVVRSRIMRGELSMGQPVSRRKLAAELGMSFLPIAEAMLRLETEGLLESRPRAGTRVPIPSPEDVEGHYVVREALEVQAAILFTQMATAKERKDLKALAARVDALSTRAERTLYVAQHQRLHFQIADGTRCSALRKAIERTHALASVWFCATGPASQQVDTRRHVQLAEAVSGEDAIRAAEAVRVHLAFGREHAMRVLSPYFKARTEVGDRFMRTDHPLFKPQ